MPLTLPQLLISVPLFFVLFFGIGFLLNMLLRSTWTMGFLYPLVVIFIVDNVRFIEYFRNTGDTFRQIGENLTSLSQIDMIVLSSGFIGAILSGVVIRMLRARGYQMF